MFNRILKLLAAGCVICSSALCLAQAPTTTPQAYNGLRVPLQIKLKLASGAGPLGFDLNGFLQTLNRQADSDPQIYVSPSPADRQTEDAVQTIDAILFVTSNNGLPDEAGIARSIKWLGDQFDAALKVNSAMTGEQRLAQIKQLDAKENELNRSIQALTVLSGVQADAQALMSEKLQRLRAEYQRLEMDRAAKEARRAALARAVDEQRANAEDLRRKDAIVQELQTIVELRQQALKRAQALVGSGMSSSELSKFETDVAEAKIRLMERQSVLGKSGKGELLDRLSDELAMISVDVTESELRLALVRDELKQYDYNSLDADSLKRVIDKEPAFHDGTVVNQGQALRTQYQEQLIAIYPQRLALKVTGAEVTRGSGDAVLGNRGGRSGRGRRGGS